MIDIDFDLANKYLSKIIEAVRVYENLKKTEKEYEDLKNIIIHKYGSSTLKAVRHCAAYIEEIEV